MRLWGGSGRASALCLLSLLGEVLDLLFASLPEKGEAAFAHPERVVWIDHLHLLKRCSLAARGADVDLRPCSGWHLSHLLLARSLEELGALVELNCETDFVAKTDEFQNLGHELCMHIAAAAPQCLTAEEVTGDVLEREREIYRQQALEEGKPANIVDKIADGKINKFYEINCLLEQAWIRDGDKKIKDLIVEVIAKLGENIVVRRFSRFSIGE